MDQQDVSGELAPADAKVFRTCVGVLLYLRADLPHCQHVVRHLATYSATMKSMTVLKHVVSCLDCHEDVCRSLKWQGHAAGIFHKYRAYPLWKPWLRSTQIQTGLATSRHVGLCQVQRFFGVAAYFTVHPEHKSLCVTFICEAEVYSCSSGGFGVRLCTSKVGRLCTSDGWSSVHVFVVCFCHCISVT